MRVTAGLDRMLSAYKYRTYPVGVQEMRLKRSLRALCWLYNMLRAEKIRQHRLNHTNLTLTNLRAMALEIRRSNPELLQVHSQAVQNVADRVYLAFQNYFEGRARFPHAKKLKDYRSFVYSQSGFRLEVGRLQLSKVGKLRVFQHRPLQGAIKRLIIKRQRPTIEIVGL
jgi:putative transposase